MEISESKMKLATTYKPDQPSVITQNLFFKSGLAIATNGASAIINTEPVEVAPDNNVPECFAIPYTVVQSSFKKGGTMSGSVISSDQGVEYDTDRMVKEIEQAQNFLHSLKHRFSLGQIPIEKKCVNIHELKKVVDYLAAITDKKLKTSGVFISFQNGESDPLILEHEKASAIVMGWEQSPPLLVKWQD